MQAAEDSVSAVVSSHPSTSTSADVHPPPPSVPASLSSLLSSLSLYLTAELSCSRDDYALLAQCNDIAAAKCSRMTESASQLKAAMRTLQSTAASLHPFLSSIDALDGSLAQLEAVVQQLDQHTRSITEQFKQLYQ